MPPTISYSAPSAQRAHEYRAVYIYCSLLTATVIGVAAALISEGISIGSPLTVAGLAGMAYWAERESIRLNSTTELSVAFLPLVFAAVAFGPLAAMVVAAASLVGDFGIPHVR